MIAHLKYSISEEIGGFFQKMKYYGVRVRVVGIIAHCPNFTEILTLPNNKNCAV